MVIQDPIRAGLSPMDNGLSYAAALGTLRPTLNHPVNVSFTDALGAAFRQDNTLVSMFESRKYRLGLYEPDDVDWNPKDHITDDDREKYGDNLSAFDNADSLYEMNVVRAQLSREYRDKQILAQAGGGRYCCIISCWSY